MRIVVILSPTNKHGTKTEYTKLRQFLLSDGYLRIAEEVFMRVATNRKGAEKYIHYYVIVSIYWTSNSVAALNIVDIRPGENGVSYK